MQNLADANKELQKEAAAASSHTKAILEDHPLLENETKPDSDTVLGMESRYLTASNQAALMMGLQGLQGQQQQATIGSSAVGVNNKQNNLLLQRQRQQLLMQQQQKQQRKLALLQRQQQQQQLLNSKRQRNPQSGLNQASNIGLNQDVQASNEVNSNGFYQQQNSLGKLEFDPEDYYDYDETSYGPGGGLTRPDINRADNQAYDDVTPANTFPRQQYFQQQGLAGLGNGFGYANNNNLGLGLANNQGLANQGLANRNLNAYGLTGAGIDYGDYGGGLGLGNGLNGGLGLGNGLNGGLGLGNGLGNGAMNRQYLDQQQILLVRPNQGGSRGALGGALDGLDIDYDSYVLLLGVALAAGAFALYQIILTKGRRRSFSHQSWWSFAIDRLSDFVWTGKSYSFSFDANY